MNWPNSWKGYLHKTLISLQSTEELGRKAKKAKERSRLWTQEELDLAQRKNEAF